MEEERTYLGAIIVGENPSFSMVVHAQTPVEAIDVIGQYKTELVDRLGRKYIHNHSEEKLINMPQANASNSICHHLQDLARHGEVFYIDNDAEIRKVVSKMVEATNQIGTIFPINKKIVTIESLFNHIQRNTKK